MNQITRHRWLPADRLGAGICVAALLASSPALALDEVRVVSEEWEYATQADGEGLYWDILRAVYEPEGIAVEWRLAPYARSVHDVRTEYSDLWVASYADEAEFALYPEWHFDADPVAAIYDPERFSEVNDADALAGHTVGWMRGYAYDFYLDIPMEPLRGDARDSLLRMLGEARIDFFLDAQIEADLALEAHDPQNRYTYAIVHELPMYMGFADNERGEQLREIWDRRMPELLADGTIAKLYADWEWEVWPFAEAYH